MPLTLQDDSMGEYLFENRLRQGAVPRQKGVDGANLVI
jgi:hypothetical protein